MKNAYIQRGIIAGKLNGVIPAVTPEKYLKIVKEMYKLV